MISPPIFLLLTVIAANSFEVAVVGNNALIDDGVGLAAMITDNSSLILFRLIVFASLPVVAGVLALAAMRRQVDRVTLQPVFYAQCFATTPVVLLCSIAATITRSATRREHSSGHHLRWRPSFSSSSSRRAGLFTRQGNAPWSAFYGRSPGLRCRYWWWAGSFCCSPGSEAGTLVRGVDPLHA